MDLSVGRRIGVAGLMVVAVTLMIWAGVHNGRERRLAMQQAQAPRVVVTQDGKGSGGDDMPEALAKLKGNAAPGFALVDLEGKKVSLAEFKGKPVVVNFWATWCAPCKLEMPWFQEFSQKYAGQGLVVLGVAADDVPKAVIAGTAKKLGVTYPVLLKDDKVEEAYGGIDYLPESFYVDRTGKVSMVAAGVSEGGKDEIEANIKKLIAGAQ